MLPTKSAIIDNDLKEDIRIRNTVLKVELTSFPLVVGLDSDHRASKQQITILLALQNSYKDP